jgi:hypothetical protein
LYQDVKNEGRFELSRREIKEWLMADISKRWWKKKTSNCTIRTMKRLTNSYFKTQNVALFYGQENHAIRRHVTRSGLFLQS